MGRIRLYGPSAIEDRMLNIKDERIANGERLRVLVLNSREGEIIKTPDRSPFYLHTHKRGVIEEVLERLEECIGFALPDKFTNNASIYNMYGIVMHRGSEAAFKVSRLSALLSAQAWPPTREQTESYLFHCLGNMLWNFINDEVWQGDLDKKNEYRDLRNYPYDPGSNRPTLRHQSNLYYVAAEDFRYLFGTVSAGRGEWHLNISKDPIPPPDSDVANFWRKEIEAYSGSYKEETNETTQAEA